MQEINAPLKNYDFSHDLQYQRMLAKKMYIDDRMYELKGELEEIAKKVKAFAIELLKDGKSTKDLQQLREYSKEISKAESKTMEKNTDFNGYIMKVTCLKCNNVYAIRGNCVICQDCHGKSLSDQDLERIKFIANRTAYIRDYLTELSRMKKQIEFKIQKYTTKPLKDPYRVKNKYFQANL